MTWQLALQNHYDTAMNEKNRAWLEKSVVMTAPLIETMSRSDILTTFQKSGFDKVLNHTLLMRTLIWQSYGQILADQLEPLNGNVRSFWYKIADPIYTRNQLYQAIDKHEAIDVLLLQHFIAEYKIINEQADDPNRLASSNQASQGYIINLCEDSLQDFVLQRIFRYQEGFQIVDASSHLKLLGEGRASLIFFLEKEGLFNRYCQRYHENLGISAIASRGFPSTVSLEYFADQLRAKKIKNVALAGLVDYDPSGYAIFATYIKKFETMGFGIKHKILLTSLDLFTEEALASKYSDFTQVHPNKEKITQSWFEATGGINGQRWGIHVNAAVSNRVHKKVQAWYDEQTQKFSDD